jgi:phosphodiesterase/alkaline phosphatase D-like protein
VLLGYTTGFGTERGEVLRALRERRVRNVVILATDVHSADFIRLEAEGVTVHEFVAGPLSGSQKRPRRLDARVRPQGLFAAGELNNFGEIEIDGGGLTARIIDEQGRALTSTTIDADRSQRAAVTE